MSRIDQLVGQHCPEGVPYWRVGDALSVVSTARGVNRSSYSEGTRIPIIDQGQSVIAGHTDNEALKVPVGRYIVFGDHTRAIKWVDFPFAVGADGTKVLRAQGGLLPKFAFYAMDHLEVPNRGYNRHWTIVRDLRIPVPPLEVQREIVRVLDQFTQLEAELKAELKARALQYVHYRNNLLTFSDETTRRKLGDLGTIFGGLTGKSKADFSDGNARFATYKNIFSNIALDTKANNFVRVNEGERQRSLVYGDILFTGSSESADEVGLSSVVTKPLDEPMYLNSFCIGFRPHEVNLLNPEFAKHLLRSRELRSQIIKTANGVTRINVSKARLAKVEVPIPGPAVQTRIAEILDNFEALTNSLSVGLPAELAARREQYEYYRDKLLTFEDAAA